MAPMLQPGDAVVVRQVAASQLKVGDIVSYSHVEPFTILAIRRCFGDRQMLCAATPFARKGCLGLVDRIPSLLLEQREHTESARQPLATLGYCSAKGAELLLEKCLDRGGTSDFDPCCAVTPQ